MDGSGTSAVLCDYLLKVNRGKIHGQDFFCKVASDCIFLYL